MYRKSLTFTAIAAMASTQALGVVVWDESIDGSLASGAASPVNIGSFADGTNSVIGSFPGGVFARDSFTFFIPVGFQLDAVNLFAYSTAGPGTTGLDAAAGTAFDNASPASATNNIGSTVILSAADVGTNVAPAGPGLFQSGSYAFTMAEGDAGNYQLDFILGATAGGASVFFDESLGADLSNSATAPDAIGTLGVGDNIVRNTVGGGDSRDNYTLTIAPGQTLDQIILTGYDSAGATDSTSLSIGTGTVFDDANPVTASNTIATVITQNSDVGGDLLFSIGDLGPGDYVFGFGEFGNAADIELNFVVIPEPASLALLGTAGLFLAGRRRQA